MTKSFALILSIMFFCLFSNLLKAQVSPNSCPITTVTDYQKAWNGLGTQCSEFKVAKNLYGSIAFLTKDEAVANTPVYIYPKGFQFAWVAGSENLERYLLWRHKYGDKPELSIQINRYAGLPDSLVIGRTDIYLTVIDYSIGDTSVINPEIFVPTAAFWFNKFRNLYDITAPLEVQKTLAFNDPNFAMSTPYTMVPIDPVKNYTAITGAILKSPDANKCYISNYQCLSISHRTVNDQNCRAWQTVKNGLSIYDPYDAGSTTAACAKAFNNYLNGRIPTASEYRAMINICQDVNPCNTFQGFGYNPSYSEPLNSNYSEHFTGTEFIVPNNDLQNMYKANKVIFIKLPDVH